MGRGSRFSVECPARRPLWPPRRAPAAPTELPIAAVSLEPSCLCIDNEPAILDGMETLLGGWGCRVLKAADLPGALAVLDARNTEPDGLLVDYHLDDGNGVGAIAALAPPLADATFRRS